MTVIRRRRHREVIQDVVEDGVGRAAFVLASLTPSERLTAYRFARFHYENPHVFDELRRLAQGAFDASMRRIGMKMLFEVLRYEIGIATNGDPFKLSNSFTAPYARLMIHTYPHLSSLFVIKGKMWVPLLWEDFPEDMLP